MQLRISHSLLFILVTFIPCNASLPNYTNDNDDYEDNEIQESPLLLADQSFTYGNATGIEGFPVFLDKAPQDGEVHKVVYDGKRKLFKKLKRTSLIDYASPLSQDIVELACNNAPIKVKKIIRYLENKDPQENSCVKLLLFVGKPGGGKTTLSQAIAQKINWPCVMIRAAEIPDEYKNSTGKNLQRIIDPILENESQCVIVIDEITHLTERSEDKQNPDRGSACALWTLLDKCKMHPSLLVIGTTNDASLLPPQLQSRIGKNQIIEIPLPNQSARQELLINRLKESNCKESFIHYLTKKTSGKSFREIEDLLNNALISATLEMRKINEADIMEIINSQPSWYHPYEIYDFCKKHSGKIPQIVPILLQSGGLGMNLYFSLQQMASQKKAQDFQEKSFEANRQSQDVSHVMQAGGLVLQTGSLVTQIVAACTIL